MYKTGKFNFLENFIKGVVSFGNFCSGAVKKSHSDRHNKLDDNFNDVAFIIGKNFNKMKEHKNEEKKRKFRNQHKKK
jgi:hypothetical protein